MNEMHYQVAVLIARLFLGVLFLLQGYEKIFRIRMVNVIEAFKTELGSLKLPSFLIVLAAYFTSYVELAGGFLLIAGLFKYYALYALGLDLVLVAVAMGLVESVWKTDIVFPRLVLLLLLLLVPAAWDLLSLDLYLGL